MMLSFSASLLCLILIPFSTAAEDDKSVETEKRQVIVPPGCLIHPVLPDPQRIWRCTALGGECQKPQCQICTQPSTAPGLCPFGYVCCQRFTLAPATCRMIGDPHIITYDGAMFDSHVVGWYSVSRDCGGFWEVRALFDHGVAPTWTVFKTMQFVFGGSPVLEVNRDSQIIYNTVLYPQFFGFPFGIHSATVTTASPRITIETTFGVTVTVYTWPRPEIHITITHRWAWNTCGWCGSYDRNPANDLGLVTVSISTPFIVVGRKREVDETVQRQQRHTACDLDVPHPDGLAYCQEKLDADSGNCEPVNTANYLAFCAFDYCLGAEIDMNTAKDFANYSLTGFQRECYPPRKASCEMCGFREITTFDGAQYAYLGSECCYEFAKDCSDDELWSVTACLKNQKLLGQDELLLSRVEIEYDNQMVLFSRYWDYVKVNGVIEEGTYTSPVTNFVIQWSGNLVEFISPDLVVKYNRKQMLRVVVEGDSFNKTCGMCGNFNDDDEDDLVTGDSFQLDSGCDAGPGGPVCPDSTSQSEAEDLCMEALQEVPCFDLDPNEFIDRCANEVCNGGLKFLCQHVSEYVDKCYCESKDSNLLDFVPDSCKECGVPKGRHGGATQVLPKTPSDCEKLNGMCLNDYCELCPAPSEYVTDISCLGAGHNKTCCIYIPK